MTHPNETIVREFLGSLLAGDMEEATARVADDIVWNFAGRSPISDTYRGKTELVRFVLAYDEMTEKRGVTETLELHDVVAGDDHVVLLWTRRGEAGDQSFLSHGAGVYHVRSGVITQVWVFHQDQYAFDSFYLGEVMA